MISRLETMVLMGVQLPLEAIRRQIASGIEILVHLGRGEDTNLNKYVNKKRSAGKVDMVVAVINALYLLQLELLYGAYDFVVQT